MRPIRGDEIRKAAGARVQATGMLQTTATRRRALAAASGGGRSRGAQPETGGRLRPARVPAADAGVSPARGTDGSIRLGCERAIRCRRRPGPRLVAAGELAGQGLGEQPRGLPPVADDAYVRAVAYQPA